MTRPWNPFVFSPTGDAAGARTPCRLMVSGPPMTPRQAAWLQAAFFAFQSVARLSPVRNLQQPGRLPDGTTYLFSITNGLDSAKVFTAAAGKSKLFLALGGVLRDEGDAFENGAWVGRKFFKENETTQYVVTDKIYWDDGQGVARAFMTASLSGPAAKLAQFGRGAAGAYRQYLLAKGLGNPNRAMGEGVFIATHEGKKVAFGYQRDGAGLRALPMQILELKEFPGLRLPREVRDLFGGLPLPPPSADWESAPVLIPRAVLDAAAGFPSGWDRRIGLDLRFPGVATTGLGQTADYVEIYGEPLATGGRRDEHSAHLRISFGLNLSGQPVATVQRITSGRYSFALFGVAPWYAISRPAVGMHKGPAAVTHVRGSLVTFSRESEVIAGRNGEGDYRLVRTVAYSWDGPDPGRTIFETMASIGVTTAGKLDASMNDFSVGSERVDTGPDSYTVFERRTFEFSWRNEDSSATAGLSDLGPLLTFGREGCYAKAQGSAQASLFRETGTASEITHYRGSPLYSYYAGEIIDHGPPEPDWRRFAKRVYSQGEGDQSPLPPIDEGAPGDYLFLRTYAKTHGEVITKEGNPLQVISDDMVLYTKGAAARLDLFDYAARCSGDPAKFKAEWGNSLTSGTRGLLYAIPQDPFGVLQPLERWVLDLSQLGGEQMVLRIAEMPASIAALRMDGMVRGSLVGSTEDINYRWRVPVWFIGELQP